jgi:hypothetical protein
MRERRVEALEPLPVLVGLGEREEARLGLLDLLPGREIDGRIVGRVDQVLADQDQPAPYRQVVDGAAVVARVDDGRGVGRQAAEVLRHGKAGIDRLGGLEERPERDGRGLLAGSDQLGGGLEDLLVQRIEEMMRLEKPRHAVVRLVVDEDGAEQRLLGLNVLRHLAVAFASRLELALRKIHSVGPQARSNTLLPLSSEAESVRRCRFAPLHTAIHRRMHSDLRPVANPVDGRIEPAA